MDDCPEGLAQEEVINRSAIPNISDLIAFPLRAAKTKAFKRGIDTIILNLPVPRKIKESFLSDIVLVRRYIPEMISDLDLLRSYAQQNSQDAFATLVGRHLNLVYSA
ncbi:MAG TPA: hypothetical protein VH255_02085, partial [Verrucomicrobiae bacterium]|nr:hypothetical protein [Verrucomicrobiae bacterium]